jgi:hypothetical protein
MTNKLPRPEPQARRTPDRASVITTAIIRILEHAVRHALHGEDTDVRAAVEATLREELAAAAQAAIDDTRIENHARRPRLPPA